MKLFSVKALSIILCIATLFSVVAVFSSCKKEKSEEKMMVLVENGKTDYKLIRADKMDKNSLDLVISLYSRITDKCGVSMLFATDWVRNDSEIDPNAKEILVGNTNRPQSKEVLESLEPNSWAVVHKGNKIVICASNDALLPLAIEWFAKNCVNEKDKTVKENLLRILNEKYGICEEDFLSAEISAVPALSSESPMSRFTPAAAAPPRRCRRSPMTC